MKILIVENVTPESRMGDQDIWMDEAKQAFGLAAEEEFDLIIGLDEDGECHIVQDKVGMGLIEIESVMT